MGETMHVLTLPAEIRLSILDYVFQEEDDGAGFIPCGKPRGLIVDESYRPDVLLAPLLVCRQFHSDAQYVALSQTQFIVSSLFTQVTDRLSRLRPKQVRCLRNLSFVADARHFRQLIEWGQYPFGMADLDLDTLTIVLHRASYWHYLFDFTSDVTMLLRHLKGVKRLVFVRNDAKVKGSFRAWYNRLIGLMMKVDHQERYLKQPSNPESTWWKWAFDEERQTIELVASPSKAAEDEQRYMERMAPLVEELMKSIESEEFNPDPRARLMYY